MNTRRIFFLFQLIMPLLLMGQNYTVESFDIVPNDLTARTNGRVDNNGRKCGLIKVYVKDVITATDGPVIGEVVDRGMEKWVYVSHDAKQIQLLFKEHMPLRITFDDFNFSTLSGNMTYTLKLKEDATDNSHIVSVIPTLQHTLPLSNSSSQSEIQAQHTGEPSADILRFKENDTYNSGIVSAIPILEDTTPLSTSSSQADLQVPQSVEQSTDQSMNQIFLQTLDANNPVIQNLIKNMVFVDGGTFKMGSKGKGVNSNEKPIHKESIKPFHIGMYEVTQKEWELIMGSNPSVTKGDNLPVENVSWEDCQRFIKILNSLTNLGFRLPTEAEWEYAAKGGKYSDEYKYSGGNELNEVAWQRANSNLIPHEVGERKSNKLGIFDMSGNVAEWTSDGFNTQYNQPRSNIRFVYRGGSYEDLGEQRFRTTYRNNESKSFRSKGLGLRLAY